MSWHASPNLSKKLNHCRRYSSRLVSPNQHKRDDQLLNFMLRSKQGTRESWNGTVHFNTHRWSPIDWKNKNLYDRNNLWQEGQARRNQFLPRIAKAAKAKSWNINSSKSTVDWKSNAFNNQYTKKTPNTITLHFQPPFLRVYVWSFAILKG